MANFEEAYIETMSNEGGYCDVQGDVGGETYKGVSRVYNPNWGGWKTIDDAKNKPNFPKSLDINSELQKEVRNFYKKEYWDVNSLDNVKNQNVADEVFDSGVNLGVKRAAKFLQEALNFLNRDGKLYPDLVVDSSVGPSTFNALDNILKNNDEEILLKIMNVLQGMHYLDYMRKSPSQEKFARGWFDKRIIL